MPPDACAFHRTFEPAGPAEFRMDRHYLLYAMEGTMRLEAAGRRWTLPPARAALIAAGEPVTISILTRLVSASVLFAPGFATPPPAPLSVFEVTPLARELIAECRTYGEDAGPLDSYARQLLATLAAVAARLALSPTPCVLPAPSSPVLARALALTEARQADAPSFPEIARESGLSPRALSRRFSEELGMTWGQTLRRIRMISAVEALAGSQAPVTEIAFSVGYASLSAFNAAFRDFAGQSPSAFRAGLRG